MADILKKEKFSRNKHRESIAKGLFSSLESSVNWVSKVIITMSFAPVITATTIYNMNAILVTTNIIISLCSLANYFVEAILNSLKNDNIFQDYLLLDLLLNTLGIVTSIYFFIYIAPSELSLAWDFRNFLFVSNIIASGINLFFLVKSVILPPLANIIDYVLSIFFNIQLKAQTNDLNIKEDKHIIDIILTEHYGVTSYNMSPEEIKEKLIPFNNLIDTLNSYINKYNDLFLGSIVNQDKIKDLKKMVNDIILYGKTGEAIKFIKKKISFKTTTINKVQDVLTENEDCKANANQHIEQILTPYFKSFDFSKSVPNKNELIKSTEAVTNILTEKKDKLSKKIDSLKTCLVASC